MRINVIRSRAHNIYTEKINKVALSCEDDKRFILEDKIHTFALKHKMKMFRQILEKLRRFLFVLEKIIN